MINNNPKKIGILISEAKVFRKWADRQPNPKRVRNWALFIGYLKQKGYGQNEREICVRMNITPQDIQKVVKGYIL